MGLRQMDAGPSAKIGAAVDRDFSADVKKPLRGKCCENGDRIMRKTAVDAFRRPIEIHVVHVRSHDELRQFGAAALRVGCDRCARELDLSADIQGHDRHGDAEVQSGLKCGGVAIRVELRVRRDVSAVEEDARHQHDLFDRRRAVMRDEIGNVGCRSEPDDCHRAP